jgi:UTP--glucose-1-phosphate uridylyltransferase
MSNQIRKAIILAAGEGTRFHPITRAVPKEMLPVVDKPILHYIVEDAVDSGVREFIIVTTAFKEPLIKRYFDLNSEIGATITFIHQTGPYGTATPVANAEHLIAGEPFALLYGDEIFLGDKPRLRQMLDVYDKYHGPVFGVVETDDAGTRKYGILEPSAQLEPDIFQIKNLSEKPGPEKTASRLAALGNYLLTPEIYDFIPRIQKSPRGEMELTDAIKMLMQIKPHYAVRFKGKIFDTGTKKSWLQTNLALARLRPDLKLGQDDLSADF